MRLTRILDEETPTAGRARALLVRLYLHGAAALLRKHRGADETGPLPTPVNVGVTRRRPRRAA